MNTGAHTDELEAALAGVELQLGRLAEALRERDGAAIDSVAAALQRALGDTLDRFSQHARRHGNLPAALRQRLLLTSSKVNAQRAGLARATAAMEQAVGLLLPRQPALYTAQGAADQARQSGSLRA